MAVNGLARTYLGCIINRMGWDWGDTKLGLQNSELQSYRERIKRDAQA